MRQIFTKNKNIPDGRTSAVRRVLAFVVLAALCCVSCRNLIEAPEETAEITESGGTEAAGKLYTLSGAVGAGGAAAKAVSALNSRSAAFSDTGGGIENGVCGDGRTADGRAAAANARSATYSPVDGSVISYTVTATNTADSAKSPEPLELAPGETTFEIKLVEGTYTLSVDGFLTEVDGKKKILYGEAKNTVTVNDTTPNPPAGTIYVNPIFDGDEPGQVNLAMTISDSCNIKSFTAVWRKLVRDDDGKLKEDESTEKTRIFKNVDGSNLTTVQFTMTEESENASDGVSAGFYRVYFHFYTDAAQSPGTELYSCSESINVYQNLTTDVWRNDAATPYIKDGTFTLTSSIIRHTFFVDKDDPNASPTNEGTAYFPFDSVKSAVSKICSANDADMYTIILLSDDEDGSQDSDDYIDISPSSPLTLTIIGNNRTINAKRTADRKGAVLRVVGKNTAVTLKNVNITGGYDYMGGGIYNGGTLTVSGGTISGCYADYGGGIYNGTGGVLSVNGCTISGCTAKNTGGGIYITTNTSAEIANCTVESCRTEAEANANNKGGAGIYTFGGTADKPVTITNCTISGINDGTVDATYGGGINNGGVLVVSGGTISGFTAKYSGGGVYSTGTLTIEGGTVTNNTAKEYGGGAIRVSGGTLRMTGGTITGCTATQYGGGIYISGSSASAAITNCTIGGSGDDKCSATRAGAIYVGSGTLTLTGGTVSGNTATTYGGGIYNYGTLTVTGGTIENCTANAAGAIYNVGTLTVSGGSVTNCTAATSGGGIYNDVTDASAVTKIENCEISGCKALGTDGANGGGGIYNNAGTLELTNCTITGGGDTGNPDARYGGGINVHSGSTLTMTGSEITNCTATLGGGVFYNGGASDMTGCTVSGNKATGNGGGIYLCGGKTFTMKGGTISGNEAATNGGGMFVSGVTFVIEYGEITGNSATTNGGGVHIDSGSTLTVKDGAKISKNNAKFGGGVSFLGGTFIMSGGTISENGASSRGGGIYRGGGTFTMGGSASVPAGDDGKNDVYLAGGKTIGIASELTAATPVATITPSAYTKGTAVLELATGSATTLADECEKFAVTAESDGTEWLVAEDGTLKSSVPEGFVRVEGGTVTGGALTPASDVFVSGRTVTIRDMLVSDHEITQEEYETYCTYGSSSPSSTYGVGNSYPAYYVNWYDAIVYCNLRSLAEGLTPAYKMGTETDPKNWSGTVESGGKYCGPSSSDAAWNAITYDEAANGWRLPTEAEWEYIARGGKTPSGTTYSGSDTADDVAWHVSNSGSSTHEVKQKAANALGIYDMSGNMQEWSWDWYGTVASDTPGTGSASGSKRVNRGASWRHSASYCNVFYRSEESPYARYNYVGFRVVRSVSQ